MATSTASVAKGSMSPSTAISYSEVSKDTNTHAGAGKGSAAFGSTSKRLASLIATVSEQQSPEGGWSVSTTSAEDEEIPDDKAAELVYQGG